MTSSAYVPGQTTTVPQADAASTASWIEEKVAVPQLWPLFVGEPCVET